jgi:hypothetical protein
MVVISNTNADQQATNLEILAQRQTHGAKPWEPHTWGLWDISIIIINGNFEETYNWEAPRNCRIPSNELSYCQPAIVQRSRPTWVIWFSNMSLLGPWPRAVGPCVPCLHVKQEFMPQVGIINITTPNARLNILGISWRKKKQLLAYPFLAMYSIIPLTPLWNGTFHTMDHCQDTTWKGALHQRFHLLLLSVTNDHMHCGKMCEKSGKMLENGKSIYI